VIPGKPDSRVLLGPAENRVNPVKLERQVLLDPRAGRERLGQQDRRDLQDLQVKVARLPAQ
jgi:hypothetical protein